MTTMSRTPRRRRHLLGAVAAVGLVVSGLAALGIFAVRDARAAETALTRARTAIQDASGAVSAGDLDAALSRVASARADAEMASGLLTRQPLSVMQVMPFVGSTARKAVALADTAARSARTGEALLQAALDSGAGLTTLALDLDSSGWLDQLASLQSPLADALAEFRDIRDAFGQAPEQTRVARIDQAGDQLLAELEQIIGTIEAGVDLAGVLPILFGQDGTQRYFVGAQNPAEQRPLGGIMGAYGFLTAINGRASLSQFISVGTLPGDLLDADTAPSEEFLNRYGTAYLGRGSWSNVNSSPHFPSVANVIEAFAPEAVGQGIDGVIVVDPFAIQTFLRVTGPVETEIGTLRADTVIEQVIRDAPEQFDSQGERRAAVGIAAETVLEAFLTSDAAPRARFDALAEVVGDGHLLMHHANPDVQESLGRLGVAGELLPPEPGNFAAIAFNTSESHVDYFTHQELDLELFLNPDGSATGTMAITIVNDAPTGGVPSYFIGPNVDGDNRFRVGDAVSLISLYCGPCNYTGVRSPDALELGRWYDNELGHRIANTVERAPAGDQVTVVHDFELVNLWDASGAEGSVSPTLWYQPTINPTSYSLTVHAPLGWALEAEDGVRTASTTIDGVLSRTASFDLRLVRSS
ncbi:DUF4012 domain-containing protein [Euzebya rosea]|uniref:DUF4012 domain-containing protein n=1 Tax=Euzebya rosea TaxID=2052804 RepID=UPI0013002C58|nr:DUF4012 domain-containing protein [Euzebya rosea]